MEKRGKSEEEKNSEKKKDDGKKEEMTFTDYFLDIEPKIRTALEAIETDDFETFLEVFPSISNTEITKLLYHSQVDIRGDNTKLNILYHACQKNRTRFVWTILEREGLDVNVGRILGRNEHYRDSYTPLYIACERNFYEISYALLHYPTTDKRIGYSYGTPHAKSCLQRASEKRYRVIVNLLLGYPLPESNQKEISIHLREMKLFREHIFFSRLSRHQTKQKKKTVIEIIKEEEEEEDISASSSIVAIYYLNGSRCYEGEYKNGKREGQGIMFNENRRKIYEGEWKNDIFDGKGVFYYHYFNENNNITREEKKEEEEEGEEEEEEEREKVFDGIWKLKKMEYCIERNEIVHTFEFLDLLKNVKMEISFQNLLNVANVDGSEDQLNKILKEDEPYLMNLVHPGLMQKQLLREKKIEVIGVNEQCDVIDYIGKGANGTCMAVRFRDKIVVLKRIDKNRNNDSQMNDVKKEVNTQYSLNPFFVVEVFGYRIPRREDIICDIFMEKMDWNIMRFIQNRSKENPLIIEEKFNIMKQMIECVYYLHTRDPQIIHRDIKCENFLINEEGLKVKICDFGTVKTLITSATTSIIRGTVPFMPPEVIQGLGNGNVEDSCYSVQSDVYSLAMSFYEMLTEKSPPYFQTVEDFKKNIHNVQMNMKKEIEDMEVLQQSEMGRTKRKWGFSALLPKMWEIKKEDRMTSQDVLKWFIKKQNEKKYFEKEE